MPAASAHAGGEPRHREIGRRAPHEGVTIDDRLDLLVARRFEVGVLDDRLHHCGAGSERDRQIVVRGYPRQNVVDC
jgi:hypothetical protein